MENLRALYSNLHASRVEAARDVESLLTKLLDAGGINYLSVSGRAKTTESFLGKAARTLDDGQLKYKDPVKQIQDQVGLRVITYLPETVDATCALVKENFEILEEIDKGAENTSKGLFGYASKHLIVQLGESRRSLPEHHDVRELDFEIQVRTTLQHAWAEFEHDVRYKGEASEIIRNELNRRFALAAGLIELADREFSQINTVVESLKKATPPTYSERTKSITPETLAAWLSSRYPDALRSKEQHYVWMCELIHELGIPTLSELDSQLSAVDTNAVMLAMAHPYPPGAVRRLDDDLLVALGDAYIVGSVNKKREETLQKRRAQLNP